MNPEMVKHRKMLDEAARNKNAFPAKRFRGRGIVICAGGHRYFTCAWVCIRMLRHLGCNLPVELWHLGEREMSDEMRSLVAPYGVTCIDALQVRKKHPARILNGWELKPFSIIHSRFREVLSLDADNVPVVDPSFLFDTPQYRETGAIFWPDFGRLSRARRIWEICGITYRDEPEFESGQIVVDKNRCWHALRVTMHINEHSDFYYHYIHGDKETFHMAFRKIGQNYSMPKKGIHALEATMCQHDFDGRRIFQHRNMAKWERYGGNPHIRGFQFEKECLGWLAELRERWTDLPGGIRRYDAAKKSRREKAAGARLTSRAFDYHRVGHDRRPMRFHHDGTIGEGSGGCEVFWDITEENGALVLDISSEQEVTCRLKSDGSDVWKGSWLRFEKMPIELTGLGA